MTRLRGWAPRGERLVDKVPQGKWKTATFLAALRNDRIEAPCLFDGPINGERFHAYVEQFLVPTLKPGDVVILDNLGSHKGKAVRRRRSAMSGLASSFCRNTRPTLTPSSRCSPSSKLCCERPGREVTKPSPTPAAKSSPNTRPPNAPHTSGTQDTRRPKSRTLVYDFSRWSGRRNRWERVAALSTAARVDREYADRLTGRARVDRPRLFLRPARILGETSRMTSKGAEKMQNDTIGVDISKDHLDAHRLSDGATRRFTNDKSGHRAFVKWLAHGSVERVVFEPTGPYHRAFERALGVAGVPFAKVNPRQARRFAEAIGRLAKTDRVDAAMRLALRRETGSRG